MKTPTKIILILLLLILSFISTEIARSPEINDCNIYFFDVGQGDSQLVQKGDFQILIDGGPDDKVLSELGKVMPPLDRKIDIIILSHPHADHLRGINSVIDRYEIGTVYAAGVIDTTNVYLEFLNKIRDQKITMIVPALYEKIIPFADADLTFLWPGEQYKSQRLSEMNNSSVVTKFCYQAQCALFTGDLETDGQAEMFEYYNNQNMSDVFDIDLLKISHHGSRNGTDETLLANTTPKIAVIEVGAENSYGHPNQDVLDLLAKYNIDILRTDQGGTFRFSLSTSGINKD